LSTVWVDSRRYDDAEAAWRGALRQADRINGSESLEAAACHCGLGLALSARRRNREAEEQHRQALRLRKAALGEGGGGRGMDVVCCAGSRRSRYVRRKGEGSGRRVAEMVVLQGRGLRGVCWKPKGRHLAPGEVEGG
jgi:hypothetical protein